MNSSISIASSTNQNTTIQTSEPEPENFIELYTFPWIFLIGTVCNTLTFLVMRRKNMRRQSTYFYMAMLAIADEIVLLVGCLNTWFWAFLGGYNPFMFHWLGCKIFSLLFSMALHYSVWLVVIMTFERFIAVALPLQASHLCTVSRAKLACVILGLIILIINIHHLFSYAFVNGECIVAKPYEDFFQYWWITMDMLIYSYIPLTILIVVNILIVHNLVKASKNIQRLQKRNSNTASSTAADHHLNNNLNYLKRSLNKKNKLFCIFWPFSCFCAKKYHTAGDSAETLSLNQRTSTLQPVHSGTAVVNSRINISTSNANSSSNRRLTIMLLVVSITFVFFSMPIVTMQKIEQQTGNMYVLRGISLILQYLNHSINFFLYAVTGKTFRKEFFALFGKKSYSFRQTPHSASAFTNHQLRINNNNKKHQQQLPAVTRNHKQVFNSRKKVQYKKSPDLSLNESSILNQNTTTSSSAKPNEFEQLTLEKNNIISSSTVSIFP